MLILDSWLARTRLLIIIQHTDSSEDKTSWDQFEYIFSQI